MIKALLITIASATVNFCLYSWKERPIYKFLLVLSAVAFAVCDILCLVKLGMLE